jgi:hypothetical protein
MSLPSYDQEDSFPAQLNKMVQRQGGPMSIFNTDSVTGARTSWLARVVEQDYVHKAVLKRFHKARRDIPDYQDPVDLARTKHAVEFEELAVVVSYDSDGAFVALLKQLPLHTENDATEE